MAWFVGLLNPKMSAPPRREPHPFIRNSLFSKNKARHAGGWQWVGLDVVWESWADPKAV